MKKEIELAMYSALQRQTPTEEHAKRMERKLKNVLDEIKPAALMRAIFKEQDEFLLAIECNALASKLVDYSGPYDVKVMNALMEKMPLDAAILLARESKDAYISFLARERADEILDSYFEDFVEKEQDVIDDMIESRKRTRHLKVPEEHILKIRKFISNYVFPSLQNPKILEKEKITHKDLKEYAKEKQVPLRRTNFSAFEKGLEYNGTFLVVRDEKGQKIPYLNPLLEERKRLESTVVPSKLPVENTEISSEIESEDIFTIILPEELPDQIQLELGVTEKVNRIKTTFQYSKKGIKHKGGKK